jgi:hypothetical protein
MQKDQKNTTYIAIISLGFIVIVFLWLPTFVSNVKSITIGIQSSTEKFQTSFGAQANEIFQDTGKEIQEKLQALEQEKQKQDVLQTEMKKIIQDHLQTTAQTPSRSSSTIRVIP